MPVRLTIGPCQGNSRRVGGFFDKVLFGLKPINRKGVFWSLIPPPPGRLKFAQICTVVARIGAPWCVSPLARHALKHSNTQRRELLTILAWLQFPKHIPLFSTLSQLESVGLGEFSDWAQRMVRELVVETTV